MSALDDLHDMHQDPNSPQTTPASASSGAASGSAMDDLHDLHTSESSDSSKTDDFGFGTKAENSVGHALTNPDIIPTLKREAKTAGQTILGMVPGIYHAATDAPTSTTEKVIDATTPGGLAIKRMAIDPAVEAAKWYGNVARGKVPNAYEQALSVAPEAVGTGAGTVIAGKLGDIAAKPLIDTVRTGALPKVGNVAREATQDVTGKTPAELADLIPSAESLKKAAYTPVRAAGKAAKFAVEHPTITGIAGGAIAGGPIGGM